MCGPRSRPLWLSFQHWGKTTRWHSIVEFARRAWTALQRRTRGSVSYRRWFRLRMVPDAACRQRVRERIAKLDAQPEISVLLPSLHAANGRLRAAIESVTRQLYDRWQLCIAVPARSDAAVEALIEEYRGADRRIRVAYAEADACPGAIANAALDLATGDFVAILNHGDELSEFALYLVAAAINRTPHADLLYSDEDVIQEDGMHGDAFFKPQWDPELILGQDYFNRLGVYRRRLVMELRGFRRGLDHSYAWDLLLRCMEKTDARRIHHIPYVLYHRRSAAAPTSDGAIKAVQEHLERMGEYAVVERHRTVPGVYKTRFLLGDREPMVSLIIPTRDRRDLLEACIAGILERTVYRRFEIIIVDNESSNPETLHYLEHLERSAAARVLRYRRPFNWSAINNLAVRAASGDVVGLVNNDIDVVSPGWLEDMAALVMRPATGAVGAMLLFPDGSVQHAGITLGVTGIAAHAHRRLSSAAPGYFGRLQLLQNYSAVTGACLLVRKDRYLEVGGLDERDFAVAFNDIDFCLKLRARGYRNLWTPDAVLVHRESASRGYEDTPEKKDRFALEQQRMAEKWARWLADDPCYNPNLTLHKEDFSLAWPARVPSPCDRRT